MQTTWKYGAWILAGLMAFGALLDALSNASQLVTPMVTYVGTIGVFVITGVVHRVLKMAGIGWRFPNGSYVRLRGLGPSQVCFMFGVILLLWYPRAREAYELYEHRASSNSDGPTVVIKKVE